MEKKRGRKKSATASDYVHVVMSLPFNLLNMFDEEAERRGYTRSEAMRTAMRSLLENWTGRRL